MTTANKGLTQPAYNSSSPTWDVPLNANFGILDTALGSTLSVSLSSSNVNLTAAQVQNLRVLLSGILSANVQVSIPSTIGGFWVVSNTTTGAYSVTITSLGGGASVVVPQGYSSIVYSDGTNIGLADNGTASLSATPAGSLIQYGGAAAPSGWLLCDGTAISRTTYAPLFTAIGTAWGVGNGSTTFNVPDLRGAFLRGAGAGLNPVSRAVGSYEADGLGAHVHSITDPGHTHNVNQPTSYDPKGAGPYGAFDPAVGATSSATTGITINSTGGVETIVKNFAALFIIKT